MTKQASVAPINRRPTTAMARASADVARVQLPAPTMRTVSAAAINPHPDFQRDLIRARVAKIADALDLDGLGVLVASERSDGGLWLVDGQHRHAALAHHGMLDWEVRCLVYKGLSHAEEAALYRRLNDTRRISAWDDFKAGLVAGDPVCVAVDRAVKQAGLRVANAAGDGLVACIRTLRQVHAAGTLAKVLADARAAWGGLSIGLSGDILSGLSIVHQVYDGELDRAAFVHKLSTNPGGPSGVLATARAMKAVRSASIARLCASVMVQIYNKGRRAGQLAEL